VETRQQHNPRIFVIKVN